MMSSTDRKLFILGLMFALLYAIGGVAAADSIMTYDATTGLLPENSGWTQYVDNSSFTETVAGGSLTLQSPGDYAWWEFNTSHAASGFPAGQGFYIESVARVIEETHSTGPNGIGVYGVGLAQLHVADGSFGTDLILYGREDEIILKDYGSPFGLAPQIVGSWSLDTTDDFHTFRIEMQDTTVQVFVDNIERITATITPHPWAGDEVTAFFGDISRFSYGTTQWRSVTVGTLPAPVPEPASVILVGIGAGMLSISRLRRKS